MKLVVGLGNPGGKYVGTRHNVGFLVVEELAATLQNSKFKINEKYMSLVFQVDDVLLAKPQTFMNRSGVAVGKLVRFYKVSKSNLYVVHDDLDIPLGKYKIQFGKGPKVHQGLQSIYRELGSEGFWHVRLGIENRFRELKTQNSKLKNPGIEYVLQRFTEEEQALIQQVTDQVVLEFGGIIGLVSE